jgi:hypothetical protein
MRLSIAILEDILRAKLRQNGAEFGRIMAGEKPVECRASAMIQA